MNCPVTRADMNEPRTQRTNWCCHCSVTYVRNSGLVLIRTSHSLLRAWRHRATMVSDRMRANINFI